MSGTYSFSLLNPLISTTLLTKLMNIQIQVKNCYLTVVENNKIQIKEGSFCPKYVLSRVIDYRAKSQRD